LITSAFIIPIDTSFNIEDLKVERPEGHTNKIMLTNDVGVELKYPGIDDVFAVFSDEGSEDIFKLVISSIKGIYNSEDYWETKDQSEEELEEFSGAGAIAGYTLPLGAGPSRKKDFYKKMAKPYGGTYLKDPLKIKPKP
jgi:hypothetical protein